MNNRLSPWLVIALGLWLAGCAIKNPVPLYEGEKRSPDQIAVLVIPSALDIKSYDDEPLPVLWGEPDNRVFHITPGAHTISLRYWQDWPHSDLDTPIIKSRVKTLHFTAEAGARYKVEPPMPTTVEAAQRFAREAPFEIVEVAETP